jgi:hypothetical protein
LGSFTTEVLGGLLKTGVGPLVFAGIVSPFAFAYVFGADWARAGVLVSWMTPWFIMQFLAVPVSMGLHVTGNQRAALNLQLAGLIWRVGLVWLSGMVARPWLSESYAVTGFVFYAFYLGVVVVRVGASWRDFVSGVRNSLWPLAIWTAMGIGAAAMIGSVGLIFS